eukprot:403342146
MVDQTPSQSYNRSHFKEECSLLHGIHPNGIYEIKYHNPKKRNAFGIDTQYKIAELFEQINKNDEVKIVVLHGGSYFSSGNDLSAFQKAFIKGDFEDAMKQAKEGATVSMVKYLTAALDLEKPLVCLVAGAAFGIACTMTGFADFIYCTPEASFNTPFMSSFQSPEGGSTITYPEQMGRRIAAEMLLADKSLSALEAQRVGYINGVIEDKDLLIDGGNFFDLNKVPIIPRLLRNDLKTMVNAKRLMTMGMNRDRMVECFKREGEALFNTWQDPEFMPKMMEYIQKNAERARKNKKKSKEGQPKL